MDWKLSKDTKYLIVLFGVLILVGVAAMSLSSIWPELELYGSGLLIIGFCITLIIVTILAIQIDKAKAREREKRPKRVMHKRLQEIRKSVRG